MMPSLPQNEALSKLGQRKLCLFSLIFFFSWAILLAARKEDFSWVVLSSLHELEVIGIQPEVLVTVLGTQATAVV